MQPGYAQPMQPGYAQPMQPGYGMQPMQPGYGMQPGMPPPGYTPGQMPPGQMQPGYGMQPGPYPPSYQQYPPQYYGGPMPMQMPAININNTQEQKVEQKTHVHVHVEAKAQASAPLIFGVAVMTLICPFCGNNVSTNVRRVFAGWNWVVILFFVSLFTMVPLCWIPFLLPCYYDVKHYCTNCSTYLGMHPHRW